MRFLFLSLLLAATLCAQFDPEGSQVISYFPQLADGGPSSQKWVTAFTFVNPHFSLPSSGTVAIFSDAGTPLALDFGNGPVSTFDFSLPPLGSVTFTSTGAPAATVTGWARVFSTLPLQSVVQFRNTTGGVPHQGISAQSTAASGIFRSPATASTGIAVANTYSDAKIRLLLTANDSAGHEVAHIFFFLEALTHQAFNLRQMLPTIPANFRGTVEISADVDRSFVAWTLSTEGGVLSSYPPSGLGWPPSYWERIWKAWLKMSSALPALTAPTGAFQLGAPPDLSIVFATNSINAYADTAQNVVHLVFNMAELTSDSESELAFVLGHALGHIVQFQAGHALFNPANLERDADQISLELAILSGFDPYGAAGALGKLFMASGNANLIDANFDNLGTHGINAQVSFQDRLGAVYGEIQGICALPQFQDACSGYKSIEHPEFPPSAPLKAKPQVRAK